MFIPAEGEVVSAKEKRGGEQGYTEDVTEKEHRVRVHPLFVERDGEGGIRAICRGCKGSQDIAFDIGKFHSAKLQKMWLLLKKEAFLAGDIGIDGIRGTKVPQLNRLRITYFTQAATHNRYAQTGLERVDFVDSRNYAIFVGDNLENHLSNDSLLQQSLFIGENGCLSRKIDKGIA